MKKMIVPVLFAVAMLGLAADPVVLKESLPPLKDGKAPQSFAEMWAGFDPQAEPLDVEVLNEWEQEGIVLKVLRYRIGVFKGRKAMMAAVYGYPKGAKKIPGLVQIHGGGQYAHHNACLTNARRGYATISIAWAGRIDAPDYRVTPEVVKLFWDGKRDDPGYKLTTDWGALDAYHAPARNTGPNAFVAIPVAEWTLDAVASPRNNSWFLCALGARRALTFLEQQPEVDADRLGVYGHSMGGKLTVLTAAADKRVKAAAPSCGGISDRYNADPLHRNTVGDSANLEHVTCPVVFLSPANDFHGHINNLIQAVAEIKSGDWRATCTPHLNHKDLPEGEVATQLWFDQHLKNSFTWPQTPEVFLNLKAPQGVPLFMVKPDTSRPVQEVEIYYTQMGHDDGDAKHRMNRINRFWHYAAARKTESGWAAHLPLFSVEKPLWVYANVRYGLENPVSGAGYYYGDYTAGAFNVSSLIKIVSPEELRAAGVKAVLEPALMIEDFKGEWKKEWFADSRESWRLRTHKLYDPQWAAPDGAKLELQVRSKQPNKLVVGIDGYAAEVALAGGDQWQDIALEPADFKNVAEKPMPDWKGIMELRFTDAEHLKSGERGDETRRLVGARWQGDDPEFRDLKWVN